MDGVGVVAAALVAGATAGVGGSPAAGVENADGALKGRDLRRFVSQAGAAFVTGKDAAVSRSVGCYANGVRSVDIPFYGRRPCPGVPETAGKRRNARGWALTHSGRAVRLLPGAVEGATNRRRKACR
jgi:hypothetical protein